AHQFSSLSLPPPPTPTLFPYTTLFRSQAERRTSAASPRPRARCRPRTPRRSTLSPDGLAARVSVRGQRGTARCTRATPGAWAGRSEEHTSELQSRFDLVCRLLLEKKKE